MTPPDRTEMDTSRRRLAELVSRAGVMVLSGAGMSTDSGIPDYRGPNGTMRDRRPMLFKEFIDSAEGRRRYWARSHIGWPRVASAEPNDAHDAVAELQAAGVISGVVTQNVDGLHDAAGSADVLDLHGRLDTVVCIECAQRLTRDELALILGELNPDFAPHQTHDRIKPDGDVELAAEMLASFRVADCPNCGGVLKPDVVFFGEAVPRDRVDRAMTMLETSRALLVLGSSLTVWSGYRFVRRAVELAVPVAIVNRGATRGDGEATLKIDAPLAVTLDDLRDRLGHTGVALGHSRHGPRLNG